MEKYKELAEKVWVDNRYKILMELSKGEAKLRDIDVKCSIKEGVRNAIFAFQAFAKHVTEAADKCMQEYKDQYNED